MQDRVVDEGWAFFNFCDHCPDISVECHNVLYHEDDEYVLWLFRKCDQWLTK
jgi:hypothetical protein